MVWTYYLVSFLPFSFQCKINSTVIFIELFNSKECMAINHLPVALREVTIKLKHLTFNLILVVQVIFRDSFVYPHIAIALI